MTASQTLIDADLHAPALSLAVLALEELGKLCAIDGLLFARPDDGKSGVHLKAGRSHSLKLDILLLLPLLIQNLSRSDPRHGNEAAYNHALAISLSKLIADGNAVLSRLPQQQYSNLDTYKQQGFYANATEHTYVAPNEAIDPGLSKLVHEFAWRATSTIDFVMKNGNLERYIDMARTIRAKVTEAEHQYFERVGSDLSAILFGDDAPEAESAGPEGSLRKI